MEEGEIKARFERPYEEQPAISQRRSNRSSARPERKANSAAKRWGSRSMGSDGGGRVRPPGRFSRRPDRLPSHLEPHHPPPPPPARVSPAVHTQFDSSPIWDQRALPRRPWAGRELSPRADEDQRNSSALARSTVPAGRSGPLVWTLVEDGCLAGVEE